MNLGLSLILTLSLFLTSYGLFLFFKVSKIKTDTPNQSFVTSLVVDGLKAYWYRLFSSIIQVLISLIVVVAVFTYFFDKQFMVDQILGFLMGGVAMLLVSFVSFTLYPKLIPAIINQNLGYLKDGILIQYKTTSSLSFLINSLPMIFLCISLLIFDIEVIIGFSLGLIFTALFLRIGGGLYYTSSDLANQLSFEFGENIPQNDKRNPGSIMELIGIYISQITGFICDVLGSYIFSVAGCLLTIFSLTKFQIVPHDILNNFYFFPFMMIFTGLASSFISYIFCVVRIKSENHSNFLLEGIYLSIFLCGLSAFIVSRITANQIVSFSPFIFGLIGAILICFLSEYITSQRFQPSKPSCTNAQFGSILPFLSSSSLGYKTNSVFLFISFSFLSASYLVSGTVGMIIAIFGFVCVTHTILQTKIFSHFSVITAKLSTLSSAKQISVQHLKKTESIGATTVAVGNGYATAAAILATFSILFSFIYIQHYDFKSLLVVDFRLLIGILIGLTLPFTVVSYLLKALSSQTIALLKEISRQYKEIPYLMENKSHPDIIKLSDHTTYMSMNAMIVPGILIGLVPIALGFVFGIKLSIGLIIGCFFTGFNQGLFWAVTGDSLHFAKRHIEDGHFGGKDSSTFYNIRSVDHIGKAYRDLLNPTLNILIKAVTIISIFVILNLA
jgi:K(+)-stimulated pyrophosphate-energized sodium pump